jgi:hypothetical protein
MNEKIKQLLEQATTIEVVEDCRAFDREVIDQQKFAELIVRECAKYVADSNLVGIPRDNIPGGMVGFFGVKE